MGNLSTTSMAPISYSTVIPKIMLVINIYCVLWPQKQLTSSSENFALSWPGPNLQDDNMG